MLKQWTGSPENSIPKLQSSNWWVQADLSKFANMKALKDKEEHEGSDRFQLVTTTILTPTWIVYVTESLLGNGIPEVDLWTQLFIDGFPL